MLQPSPQDRLLQYRLYGFYNHIGRRTGDTAPAPASRLSGVGYHLERGPPLRRGRVRCRQPGILGTITQIGLTLPSLVVISQSVGLVHALDVRGWRDVDGGRCSYHYPWLDGATPQTQLDSCQVFCR